MSNDSLIALAAGVAVVSIGVYHVCIVAPRLRAIARTLAGSGDEAEAASLAVVRAAVSELAKRTNARFEALEAAAAADTLRVGFLRYNSFSDVGSDQSFTLALLSNAGDGVVVSSIFAREERRTYGKAVRAFVPQQGASEEERAAIAMARGNMGALART
jgi:hypothetical protein